MQRSGVCRWLRQQHQPLLVLLLLSVAATSLLGHCSRTGVGVNSGSSASNEFEADAANPPLPKPLETRAKQEEAVSIHFTTARKGASQTRTWTLGQRYRGNTLVMLALFVATLMSVAATARLATTLTAAKESEKKDFVSMAKATKKLEKGETAVRKTLGEIALVIQEKEAAAESVRLLQEWQQRPVSRVARSLVSTLEGEDAAKLQMVLCRVRRAQEMRNSMLAELEAAQLRRTLAHKGAVELMDTIEEKKEELDESVALYKELTNGSEEAKTGEEAIQAKDKQLPVLLARVDALKGESKKLEAEAAAVTTREPHTYSDKLSKQVAELEAKKASLLLLQEEDELFAATQEADIRELLRHIHLAEMKEKKLSMELADLRNKPLMLVTRQKRLHAAAEKLKGNKREIENLMEQLAKKESIPRKKQDLATLYPEEMALFEARVQLEHIKASKDAVLTERALHDDSKEREAVARAKEQLAKAEASLSFLKEQGDFNGEELMFYEDKVRKAKAVVAEATQELEDKLARKETLELLLNRFGEQIVEANEKVTHCARKRAEMVKSVELKCKFPEAFAMAEGDRALATQSILDLTLNAIRIHYSYFSEDMFLKMPRGYNYELFWLRRLQLEADDYLQVLTALMKHRNHMLDAANNVYDYLQAETLVEELQEIPLKDLLFSVAHEGMDFEKNVAKDWRLKLDKKISENEKMQKAAEEEVRRLREKIQDLARSRYWALNVPKKKMAAMSYVIRKEYELTFLQKQHARLSAVTENDITKEVRRCLMAAVDIAIKRREMYGTDPVVQQQLQRERREVLTYIETQVKQSEVICEIQLEDFAPFFDVADLPVPPPVKTAKTKSAKSKGKAADDIPSSPTLPEEGIPLEAEYHAVTHSNVLQLRKKKRNKGNEQT